MRNDVPLTNSEAAARAFAERVRTNQRRLAAQLQPSYDFIVCGSGSSGSVVARRLAEDPAVHVLLIEAGGSDDVPSVMAADQWHLNLGSERDWNFTAQPNPHLNGRAMPLPMGRVLGGGSSINVMAWARGHRSDWDFFAQEARDPSWSYAAILDLYRRIEDWRGIPDPDYRGVGGPVFVQPAPDPNPIAPAMVEGACSVGIPAFQSHNGRMMESDGGAAVLELRVREGRRLSVFRTYTFPLMDRLNLTVLTDALVTRVMLDGSRATGVELVHAGRAQRIDARLEVVLSLGAMHTPKVLMLSGIGDAVELRRLGIPVVQHLPGVGRNFQDHVAVGCIWEYEQPLPPRNNGGEATCFWKSDARLDTPDLQICQVEVPFCSRETAVRFSPPPQGWTLFGGVVRPQSQGQIRLTGPRADDLIKIEGNAISHPDDLRATLACVEICREIGNSLPLRPYAKREVMPGDLNGAALEDFIRDAASTFHHQTCTAKMGRDSMSVVDAQLRVHGIRNLRIADGSVMPRVTTGNTMAPCIVIGERAGEMLRAAHKI